MEDSSAKPMRAPAPSGEPRLPLGFPTERWARFDEEERAQFVRAQSVIDSLQGANLLSFGALVRGTDLARDEVGAALRLLQELSLVQLAESGGQTHVELVATPEDHIGVRFPDGRLRWVFVSRPVREPQLDAAELN